MTGGRAIRVKARAVVIIGALLLMTFIYFLFATGRISGDSLPSFRSATQHSTKVDLLKLLAVAIEVSERGGQQVRQVRKEAELLVRTKGKTREGVSDPLTEGDLRSHWQMYNGVKLAFPNINVISEERSWAGSGRQPTVEPLQLRYDFAGSLSSSYPVMVDADDVTVWIDPLDATKEYTEILLHYVTTMVCVAVRGVPVIGVIHQPFNGTGTTYWAWAGHGHSANISPRLSSPAPRLPVKVLVSRSHPGAVAKLATRAFKSIRKVTAAGAGYKTLALLDRTGDVYLHTTLIKKWDTCAPTAVLESMGGDVTSLSGATINYAGSEQEKHEVIEDGVLAALYNHQTYLARVRQSRNS